MKKFKITFIILFLIVAITLIFTMGGKSNDDNNASFTHITDIATINWDCLNINNEEFKLSSIFSNYSLLSLENSKSSFIGEISKIEYYDSLLLVLDKKHLSKIFVFNNTDGKFYRTIGKIGQGPGEYLSLNDFSIDKENNKVYLLCNKNKIYTYSLLGEFIEVKDLPFYASQFEFQNERFYFNCDTRSTHQLVITDKFIKILSKHFENNLYKDAYREQIHHFQKRNEEIIFHRFLDNNIYKIDKNGEISVCYRLNLGNDAICLSDISNFSQEELKKELKRATFYKYFTETNNYAFVVFFKSGIPYISIYDKISKKSMTYKYENSFNDYLNDNIPILEYEHFSNGFAGVLPYNSSINDNIDDPNPTIINFY